MASLAQAQVHGTGGGGHGDAIHCVLVPDTHAFARARDCEGTSMRSVMEGTSLSQQAGQGSK